MSKFNLLKGIIIRKSNSKDADLVVTLIDEKGQQQSLIAKGVKKTSSKKSYAIEVGNFVECKVVEGYSIPILTEIKLINAFPKWKDQYISIIYLQLLCEVISRFVVDNQEEPELFKIFFEILSSKSENKILLCTIFLIKVLNISGFLPDISLCAVRQSQLEQGKIFYDNSIIGFSGFKSSPESFLIEDIVYKVIKFIINNSVADSVRLEISEGKLKFLLEITVRWVEIAIEKELKSKRLIQ